LSPFFGGKSVLQSLVAGSVLSERYEVVSLVGQGGMGAVYECRDLRLPGRVCAVKEVRLDPFVAPDLLLEAEEQFRREAQVLARLDHPNLPKVSDYFATETRHYLVMDYVAGNDLAVLVAESNAAHSRLSVDQVLHWIQQLASALTYLHSQSPPILHRDIKPSNIKLTPSGVVKLVDFGLVKAVAQDDTATVTVIQGRGTAPYTPLEQYGGDIGHTDVRSDVYGLGATLYHLLTGHPPDSARDRFLKPTSMPEPGKVNPDVPPSLSLAVMRALALHPDQRPASVSELMALISAPYDETLSGNAFSRSARDSTHLNNWPLAVAVIALLAAAVALSTGI
jgi:eukaryotic-like serine/threonine-protein kinase